MNRSKLVISNYFIITYIVLSIFLLFYFFYKVLTNDPNNQLIYNYNLLILINILIILVLGIIFLKANNYIKNILVILSFVLIITSYSFEFYLYLNHYSTVEHNLPKKIAKNIGYKYDARPFQKIREDLLRSNKEEIFYVTAVKNEYYEKNKFFHLAYGSFKKIHLGTEGKPGFFTSDRYGFRNNDKIWDTQEGVIEFATIGDGYSIGCCINDGTIADHIERITQKAVLNLGISGSGPLKKLALLREYGNIIKPKNIIWLFNDSNIHYTIDEINNPYLSKYQDKKYNYNLVKKQEKIDRAFIDVNYQKIQEHNKIILRKFFKLYGLRLFLSNISSDKIKLVNNYYRYSNTRVKYSADKNELVEYKKILLQVKNLVESWGSKIYFVYLPVYNEVLKINSINDKFLIREQVRNLITSIDIEFIDVYEESIKFLDDKKSIFPLGLNFHYNSAGYEISAIEILKKIDEEE